jgi:ferritin-like metal-binding protein YciE
MPLLDSCHVLTGSTRLRVSMFRQVSQSSARSFRNRSRNSTHVDAATLLNQTLNEEKATDKKLTEMAESQINRKVA